MKRMHIGIGVRDINASIEFYNTLFGAEPSVVKHDYAKWVLEDPRVNFSITTNGERPGDVHFGVQVDGEAELETIAGRLDAAGENLIAEPEAVCCYHKSVKNWVLDPQSFRWETFFTHDEATHYGENNAELEKAALDRATAESCC